MQKKKKINYDRVAFLKTFFDKEEGYEEKEINGWWLVKYRDNMYNRWWVAIYSAESFKKYKERGKNQELPI